MKLSISLSADEVATLDEYRDAAGLPSRSAAVQAAIKLLSRPSLEDDYVAAWEEWAESGEEGVWSRANGDGIDDAAG